MGELLVFGKWLDHTVVGTAIRESLWLFPIIETLHIFGHHFFGWWHFDSGPASYGTYLSG
jgi:hypothetical protein